MPLTVFQAELARDLAANRTPDSHLAGGAALHIAPNSIRYSNDLDYFQDSVDRVASAFIQDEAALSKLGYGITTDITLPGYIRGRVSRDGETTKVEWAHDSAWRFLPTLVDPRCGYRLHPVDVAVNKVLALVGRNEPRDYVDTLVVDKTILSLGALCWAAPGKDPGFTPNSLLAMLRRSGKHRPEELRRLRTGTPLDPIELKQQWLRAIELADAFLKIPNASDIGCLFWHRELRKFVTPSAEDLTGSNPKVVRHHGRPGGVLPQVLADD